MPAAYFYSSTAGAYTLTGSITNSATSFSLSSVTGLPGSLPFKVVLDPGQGTEEIVKVTGIAGTTLTVVRGWEGTAANAHAAGASVRHALTAEDITLSRTHEAGTSGVHGVAGSVVGTTDVQTLTNKTLNAPVFTGTMTAAAANFSGAVVGTTANFPAGVTAGPAADVLGTALAIMRNGVQVGRVDNNANGTRVQALTGTLQLRGTGDSGISIDAAGNATFAAAGTFTGNVTAPNQATLTGAQALTNKDLTSGTNTFPPTLGPATSTYTPTITGVAVSASSGRYWRTGNTVRYEVDFTISAAPTGSVDVSLPVATATYPNTALRSLGHGISKDVSAGFYLPVEGEVQGATSYSAVTLMMPQSTTSTLLAFLGATSPWAWANGDTVSIQGSYPI